MAHVNHGGDDVRGRQPPGVPGVVPDGQLVRFSSGMNAARLDLRGSILGAGLEVQPLQGIKWCAQEDSNPQPFDP